MPDKQQDVAFLAETFDIPPRSAAALVAADEAEAAALTQAQPDEERNRDPLGDAPVPQSPEDHEIAEDGGLQKTELRRTNKASQTGP